jgi:predicted 2-oxoglutarate/Fe(II)-dependent dioxygenase YbiX
MKPNYFYINNILTKEECELITSTQLAQSLEKGGTSSTKQSILERNSIINWVYPGNHLDPLMYRVINAVRQHTMNEFDFPVGHGEIIQFSEYGFLHHYREHIDSQLKKPYRFISATVQLTDPKQYIGGKLQIKRGPHDWESTPVEQGTLTVFPSMLPHRVTPILWGKRHSLALWFDIAREYGDVQ